MKTYLLALSLVSAFSCFSQNSKLLKAHRYSEVISDATTRLNVNPNDKKAKLNLQEAYSEALVYFQSELNRIQAGNDSLKWSKSLDIMQETNDLSRKIQDNSVAAKIIREPKVYTSEIQEVKSNAIDELVTVGKVRLNQNNREKARDAYSLLKKALLLSPENKEINVLVENARKAATYSIVINPVRIDFNTLNVSTKKIDKEFFYWTQRDVTSRPFIRLYTATDAEKLNVDPDFYIQSDVQDYRVEKLSAGQTGSGVSNLMAIGNLNLKIYSAEEKKVVFKKSISCRFDTATKSRIRVNTIDIQRVVDPDIQTFFDYLLLSNFDRITSEIEDYFSTLVKP